MIVLVTAGTGVADGLDLADGEEHHLRVRRAEDGEPVELRDGAGFVGAGKLVRRGKGWGVQVTESHRVERPPVLMLGVGAGDRDRFEWLVEKATELGASAVIPVETERAMAVSTRLRAGQIAKLRRRALEAIKQCGAAWAPAISEPEPLGTFLARPVGGSRWLADPEGGAATLDGSGEVAVMVGPEGGLTPAERSAAIAAGYRPVRLAPNVLRFETAAIAAAALALAVRAN